MRRLRTALALFTLVGSLLSFSQLAKADTGTSAQMTARLNAYRLAVGAPAIAEDARVASAAGSHALYNATNNILGHSETPGLPGFTGTDARSRLAAAGYRAQFVSEVAASYSTWSTNVDELWHAPYHRLGMMHPHSTVTGWGHADVNGRTSTVGNFVYNFSSVAPNYVRSPGTNQTGIPTSWNGAESPSPLPAGTVCPCGYPIMVVYRNAQTVDMRAAEVVAPDGSRQPLFYAPRLWENDYQIIIPQRPLAANTKYHVRLDLNVNGQMVTNEWDFSTSSSSGTLPSVSAPLPAPSLHSAWVSQSSYLTLAPGAIGSMTVRFRNTGTTSWKKGVFGSQINLGVNGDNRTYANLGMAVNWPSPDRVAFQSEDTVAPGEIATFTFQAKAPQLTGTYAINVRPVVDGVSWLEDNGVFMHVTSANTYHSAWSSQSTYPTLKAGETSSVLQVSFKNTGTSPWVKGALNQEARLGVNGDNERWASLGVNWPYASRVAVQDQPNVAPGQTGSFSFQVKAPQTPGTYYINLRPVIDGTTWMEDQGVWLLVTVVP